MHLSQVPIQPSTRRTNRSTEWRCRTETTHGYPVFLYQTLEPQINMPSTKLSNIQQPKCPRNRYLGDPEGSSIANLSPSSNRDNTYTCQHTPLGSPKSRHRGFHALRHILSTVSLISQRSTSNSIHFAFYGYTCLFKVASLVNATFS